MLLNVLKQNILNQNQSYKLLSKAFFPTFSLCISITIDLTRIWVLDATLIIGDFDMELQEFILWMMIYASDQHIDFFGSFLVAYKNLEVISAININKKFVGLVDCQCNTIFVHFFLGSLSKLGIVGSHIENEHIFNVVNVIANFQWSKLVFENLDYLIIIIKNWPNILQVGCDGAIYESYDI
jgi:hypothetical protein